MKTHLVWLAVAILAFGLGYKFPKRTSHQPSVESIRREWVAQLKQLPPKQPQVIHAGGPGTHSSENFVLGIVQAGFDTGHPTIWTTEPSTPEYP